MPDAAIHAEKRVALARVLGVNFFDGSLKEACVQAERGGLLTAPSGPGLAYDLVREPAYRRALEASDLVLTDSAFMVLLWRLRTGQRLPRNSGLAFLRIWMNRDVMKRPGAVVWVMPSAEESRHTQRWLADNGYPSEPRNFYVAPHYPAGPIVDEELAAFVEERQPEVVYLGIGGGVQERLGHYLRDHVTCRPLILCLGAAIAFLTGAQVHISPWVDRFGLGWLWRIASDPARYWVRYFRATRLAWMVFRFGVEAPPSR